MILCTQDIVEGKKILPMEKIASYVDHGSINFDWILFGVIGRKSEAKTSKNNEKYMIIDLCDMVRHTIKIFLFGRAFETYWKQREGTLVCIANAKPLPPREGGGIAVSINQTQMKIIGEAIDFDFCAAYVKNTGVRCSEVVNKKGTPLPGANDTRKIPNFANIEPLKPHS